MQAILAASAGAHRRRTDEDDDLGRTRTRSVHCVNDSAPSSGVNAMNDKLNLDDLFVVIGQDDEVNAKVKKALVAKIADEWEGPYKPKPAKRRKAKKEAK
jgi:hypothetical protein